MRGRRNDEREDTSETKRDTKKENKKIIIIKGDKDNVYEENDEDQESE